MNNEEIIRFLRELKENNCREWFLDNKKRYEAAKDYFTDSVQQMINKIALFDPEVAGMEAKNCVFRIYRDIRFSPDKTPYKTHFGAYMARGGRVSERASYYLHIEPDGSLLSGGIYMPQPKFLKILRQDIYDQIDEFMSIIEEPSFKKTYPSLDGEVLKRNPAGFPESPYDNIIRHKDFCVVSYKPDYFFLQEDWQEKSLEDFRKLFPFNRFLNYSVDEYKGI